MTRSPLLTASGVGWLVMEKPCGMSVHNQPGKDLLSLSLALVQSAPENAFQGWDPDFGVHPVHRLDAETSGLVLLALNAGVFHSLSQQFEEKTIQKEYLALVHGSMPEREGLWKTPLSTKAEGRQNPQGAAPLVDCETRYAVSASSARYTLLRCFPLTGRTHQIRRHAALSGHPLVGDRRYAPARALRFLEKNWPEMRLGLHATTLSFQPPEGSTFLSVESRCTPEAFDRLMERDRP